MKAKRWIVLVLKLLLAAALLTFVGFQLSWSDSAQRGEAGEVRRGSILASAGEGAQRPWTAPRVQFRFEGDPPALDPSTRAVSGDAAARELECPAWRIQPSFPRLLSHLDLSLYFVAAGLFFCGIVICVTRWWILLRSAEIPFTFRECFRLTFIGQFFNTVVPGLTGGDLVKAFMVARRTDNRTAAVVSVFVDRILGMFTMALLAGITVLFIIDEQPTLALGILAFIAAMVLGMLVFFSHRIRGLLRLEAILDRLPGGSFLRTIDQAVFVYRYRLRAVGVCLLLSFMNHAVAIFGVFLVGRALATSGEAATIGELYVIYPVAGICSALPITPAGLGVGESLFGYLFKQFSRSVDVGVLTSVIFRLTYVGWSLLGAVFLVVGRETIRADEMDRELMAQAAAPAGVPAGGKTTVET